MGGRGGKNAVGRRALIGQVLDGMDSDLKSEHAESANQSERQKAT